MVKNELSANNITHGLNTRFTGQKVVYRPVMTSTMDVARQEIQKGAVEGTAVITDEQTAGYGRLRRTWLTPQDNIAISIILYPARQYLPSLIMASSLAVAASIENVTGLKSQLKWPNDVLINGKKVCGILIESQVQADTVNYAVIGIGINVNLNTDNFPEISPIATSLFHELGREVSRLTLIQNLLTEFERLYLDLQNEERVFEEWRDKLITLGKQVRVTSFNTIQEGIAESVTRDGSLMLRLPDGSLTRILAGDVTLRNDEHILDR